jgi:hypothetical protein
MGGWLKRHLCECFREKLGPTLDAIGAAFRCHLGGGPEKEAPGLPTGHDQNLDRSLPALSARRMNDHRYIRARLRQSALDPLCRRADFLF